MHVLSFIWDPSPGIDLGFFMIRYYSLMFVIAFTIGWFLTKNIFKNELGEASAQRNLFSESWDDHDRGHGVGVVYCRWRQSEKRRDAVFLGNRKSKSRCRCGNGWLRQTHG